MDKLIEYLACFGGMEEKIELDFFKNLEENIEMIYCDRFRESENFISPGYLMEYPYRDILISIAKSDGKVLNVFKRAGVGESFGGSILSELKKEKIIDIVPSREEPFRGKGTQIKKELRRYRIQPKVRFRMPYMRFWFGFVEPFRNSLGRGECKKLMDHFTLHKERVFYLVFEQLSTDLLIDRFARTDPIVESGSMWDFRNEFDILCYTESGKTILGECKYSSRKICRNELSKLKEKAEISNISVDFYALFSKSAFSRELDQINDERVLLFGLEDFRTMIEENRS